MLDAVLPRMLKAQERILSPLSVSEAKVFIGLMQKLIDAHESAEPVPESVSKPSTRSHHRR